MTMARGKDAHSRPPRSGAADEATPAPEARAVEVPASSVHAYTNSLLERVIQLLLISLLSIGVQVREENALLGLWQRRAARGPARQRCGCGHEPAIAV